jgi:hypothetical protein
MSSVLNSMTQVRFLKLSEALILQQESEANPTSPRRMLGRFTLQDGGTLNAQLSGSCDYWRDLFQFRGGTCLSSPACPFQRLFSQVRGTQDI